MNSNLQNPMTEIATKLLESLYEVNPSEIVTYYDFLVVAKKLELRFQESGHLMALKTFFMKNNNNVKKSQLCSVIVANHNIPKAKFPGKTVVKFVIPQTQFQSIKQVTDEDEDSMNGNNQSFIKGRKRKSFTSRKYNILQCPTKAQMFFKIQASNTMKKIQLLNKYIKDNIFFCFGHEMKQNFTYDGFKKKVLKVLGEDKIREDQVQTIFSIADKDGDGIVSKDQLRQLANNNLLQQLIEFYKAKSQDYKTGGNQSMSSLQIYKTKTPSTIQLSDVQQSILSHHKSYDQNKRSTKPRFGPLKHFNLVKPHSTKLIPVRDWNRGVLFEKSKIQKILKSSKGNIGKKQNDPNETISSKLRRLFVQRVILPRQKLFQQYRSNQNKNTLRNFQIRNERI